jgi:hypothetical protein
VKEKSKGESESLESDKELEEDERYSRSDSDSDWEKVPRYFSTGLKKMHDVGPANFPKFVQIDNQ